MSSDPDRGELLCVVTRFAANSFPPLKTADDIKSVIGVRASGVQWRIDSIRTLATGSVVLPIDSLQYLTVLGSHVTEYDGRTDIVDWTLPASGPLVTFLRLQGSYIARLSWIDTVG